MKGQLVTVGALYTLFLLASCTTASIFRSPNNVDKIKSTVYLNDGRSISGYLTINTENKKNNKISIQQEINSKPLTFKLKSIKGYTSGADNYELKEVENTTIIIEKGNSLIDQMLTKKKYFFMKRLTPDSSRIHLYENDYIKVASEVNSVNGQRMTEYYIQLPNDISNTVYALDSKKLLPDFDKKMSALVSDCPILAAKIAQKQPGYTYANLFLPILSNTSGTQNNLENQNLTTLLTIAKEYNQCK